MFRTRLAALVVAGSLCFSNGCAGIGNLFGCGGSRPCCNSGPPPCCGGEMAGVFSSPVDSGPILVPQGGMPGGMPGDPGAVVITPTPTPARLQQMPPTVPQSVPVPAMPSGLLR